MGGGDRCICEHPPPNPKCIHFIQEPPRTEGPPIPSVAERIRGGGMVSIATKTFPHPHPHARKPVNQCQPV